jgi:hypothetical protein
VIHMDCYNKGFVVTLSCPLVFVFECERISYLNAFFFSLLQTGCCDRPRTLLAKVFHLLILYYDSLFGVYQDLTRSCMPGLVSELMQCCFEFSSI